jgi:hypothetical protein
MSYLRLAFEALRFIKRYRERVAAQRAELARERQAERDHQRLLVETLFVRVLDIIKVQQDGLLKLGEAEIARAEAFSSWLKGFQVPSTSPEPSHRVTEDDEWLAEQAELRAQGDPSAFPVDLPPEFQLAAALAKLNQDSLGEFDREGSDFN